MVLGSALWAMLVAGIAGPAWSVLEDRERYRMLKYLYVSPESWSYPDAFAGAMFLVSGVVFPLAVLPDPVELIGLFNPITWWVAGVRLAVVPDGPSSIGGAGSLWTAVTGTSAPDAATILAALFVTGAVVTLAATAIFRSSERLARERGLLDRTTGS